MSFIKVEKNFFVLSPEGLVEMEENKQKENVTIDIQLAIAEIANLQLQSTLETQMAIAELASTLLGGDE